MLLLWALKRGSGRPGRPELGSGPARPDAALRRGPGSAPSEGGALTDRTLKRVYV